MILEPGGSGPTGSTSAGSADRDPLQHTGSGDIRRRSDALTAHDDLHMIASIDAELPDTPDNGPKTEAALLTWFQEYFVS